MLSPTRRSPFTEQDDYNIVYFMLCRNKAFEFKGDQIYKDIEAAKVHAIQHRATDGKGVAHTHMAVHSQPFPKTHSFEAPLGWACRNASF